MDVYKLMNGFWQIAELENFSTTATSLYFYLLQRGNKQRWCMPIRCSTENVRCHIGVSKQSVLNAREELSRCGLVDFTPGTGKGNYALYTLKYLTDNLMDSSTEKLTDTLTLYNNKDNKTGNINNKRACEELLSLEDLEEKLSCDDAWHQSVISLISTRGVTNIDINTVRLKLKEFFLYLRASGFDKREEIDCKSHFVNWLAKNNYSKNKISQTKYDSTNKENYDRRRGWEVTATSAEDYESSF